MSNPQAERQALDNIARLQQMKVNARQFATTMALELIKAPNYSLAIEDDGGVEGAPTVAKVIGGKVDHVTLLAMARDIEDYIMGNLEKEATDAMDAAKARINGPKIVRP